MGSSIMDNVNTAISIILSFLLSILSISYRLDKKRNDDNITRLFDDATELVKKIAVLEATAITEKNVRLILKDCLDPIVNSMETITNDVQSIKIQLASMSKRKDDA